MRRLGALAIGLLLCAAAGRAAYLISGHTLEGIWVTLRALDAPVSDDPTPVVFAVAPGQTAAEIGAALERQGLVRSAAVFRLLVEQEGVSQRLAAGEYELSPAMSTREIIAVLASGRVRSGPLLTIPEGWRAEEIAWKLETLAPGTGAQFLEIVYAGGAYAVELGLPPDSSLEGFLFPATYAWRPSEGVEALIAQMVAQFRQHFTAQRREQAAARGLTLREVVTLASIIEREAVVPEERALIAGVYYNRLARGMPLQADPTVQYALAAPRVPIPGPALWKRELTLADLAVPSPYNTYQQVGLPAGPICNPGLASLDAALQPAATDALYFVARGDGSHVFARTAEEHAANVRRYQPAGRY